MSTVDGEDVLNGWSRFFSEVITFLSEAERQFGIANQNYAEYTLQRMDMAFSTCSSMLHQMTNVPELQAYVITLNELCNNLRYIYRQWSLYEDHLDSGVVSGIASTSYKVGIVNTGSLGRPRFDISKDQLEYLSSLGFKWTEVAALLGVSRMTIYRYAISMFSVR